MIMNYEEKYKEALEKAKELYSQHCAEWRDEDIEYIFPELKESEDEKIRKELLEHCKNQAKPYIQTGNKCPQIQSWITWLEKQESEPNWCHHKVDLSNCSEEYRKAYYDGWNDCNMQHSQCESEKSNVLKCLINGMKFYYEDNEEATWGTEKFSMKVKDILTWLEKQGQKLIKSGEWDINEFRTWQYIVSDVLTKWNGIGQYLDGGEYRTIAKKMQEEWSKKLA